MSKICFCCGKPMIGEGIWHNRCVKRFFGGASIPEISINDAIHEELASLSVANGQTVTGVQKKLSITLSVASARKTNAYSGEYIVKTGDVGRPSLPEYEFVGMKMAEICGFKTVPNGLIYSKQGESIYISRRIDRVFEGGRLNRIAMEDFAQLSLTQTEYKYSGSYERCAKKVIERFSSTSYLDKIELFRMCFFSYIIGNTDMHLKNFSLIKGASGYSLAPFYDILPVLMVVNQQEMALTINGKSQKLTRNDFLSFGSSIGLGKPLSEKLMGGIISKMPVMFDFLRSSPLPEESANRLVSLIASRAECFL